MLPGRTTAELKTLLFVQQGVVVLVQIARYDQVLYITYRDILNSLDQRAFPRFCCLGGGCERCIPCEQRGDGLAYHATKSRATAPPSFVLFALHVPRYLYQAGDGKVSGEANIHI